MSYLALDIIIQIQYITIRLKNQEYDENFKLSISIKVLYLAIQIIKIADIGKIRALTY